MKKFSILPKTLMGKRSVIMMLSIFVLFIFGSALPWKPGYHGFEIVTQNPIQGILTILMLFIGVATAGMALISVEEENITTEYTEKSRRTLRETADAKLIFSIQHLVNLRNYLFVKDYRYNVYRLGRMQNVR